MKSLPVVLLLIVLTMAGCKNKAPEQSELTEYEQAMTSKDTAAVTHLIDMFFEYLERGEVTNAVAMLYTNNDSDIYAKPDLLDNEQIPVMTQMLKSFPIVGHRIEYIKFSEAHQNEVKVKGIIAHAEGDRPEITTDFYFKPVDHLNGWHLTMVNSRDGDVRLISNAKTDSMQQRYQQELEMKKAANQQQQ